MSCGVGDTCSSDLAWRWLWLWPAAIAPVRPLAWEPPYAMGIVLKKQKKKKFHSDLYIWSVPCVILFFNTQGQAQKAELDVTSQKPLGGVHFMRE